MPKASASRYLWPIGKRERSKRESEPISNFCFSSTMGPSAHEFRQCPGTSDACFLIWPENMMASICDGFHFLLCKAAGAARTARKFCAAPGPLACEISYDADTVKRFVNLVKHSRGATFRHLARLLPPHRAAYFVPHLFSGERILAFVSVLEVQANASATCRACHKIPYDEQARQKHQNAAVDGAIRFAVDVGAIGAIRCHHVQREQDLRETAIHWSSRQCYSTISLILIREKCCDSNQNFNTSISKSLAIPTLRGTPYT